MKIYVAGLVALGLLSGSAAYAQETTVVHKESADGERSKTVVKHENGSKTVIKRHGSTVKKVHTSPDGDKTIVKKTTEN